MNPSADNPKLTGKFERLISIELRFNKETFLESVNLYCTLLGLSPRPESNNTESFYSYVIGRKKQKMELRFVQIDSAAEENRTILYWLVPEYDSDSVYNELLKIPGYTCEAEPSDVEVTPTDKEKVVRRSIVKDPSGNLMGQVDPIGHNPFPMI